MLPQLAIGLRQPAGDRGVAWKPPHSLHSSRPEADTSPSRGSGEWPNLNSHTVPENVCILKQTLGDTQGNYKASVSCNVYDPETRTNGHLAWFALLVNVVLARSKSRVLTSSRVISSVGFERHTPNVSSGFFYHGLLSLHCSLWKRTNSALRPNTSLNVLPEWHPKR